MPSERIQRRIDQPLEEAEEAADHRGEAPSLNTAIDLTERIAREAQAMSRPGTHPGVASLFDPGEHEGRPSIVAERMGDGARAVPHP